MRAAIEKAPRKCRTVSETYLAALVAESSSGLLPRPRNDRAFDFDVHLPG